MSVAQYQWFKRVVQVNTVGAGEISPQQGSHIRVKTENAVKVADSLRPCAGQLSTLGKTKQKTKKVGS